MAFPSDQLDELTRHAAEVSEYEEGGLSYIWLEGLQLPPGCTPEVCDALLLPRAQDGYPSRLYFYERIQSARGGQNWNGSVRILEQNWHAFSWKVTREDLRLEQLLVAHLKGLV